MITPEASPFASTGGLGDVLGALPPALAAAGDTDVRVMLPLYGQVDEETRRALVRVAEFTVPLGWRRQYCGVFLLRRRGVTYYFLDNEYYFKREGLYGAFDDGERFAYFCAAALEALPHIGFFPDILHAHDWQSALSVIYLCARRHLPGYGGIRTVFTIHNIEYQGRFSHDILGDVFGLDDTWHEALDCDGALNLMKGAILCADRVTTVSPRYADEIRRAEAGRGLDGILRFRGERVSGILNGIDCESYDPAHDGALALPYDADGAARKRENKTALQRELSLPVEPDLPLIAVVSRLVAHKGLDLVFAVADRLCERAQFVLLGCGEPRYEEAARALEARRPDRARACIRYDRALSRRIYAAADLFLMPSASEPCGTAQLIAARYGAIPVVHETGGLADTVKGFWREGETLHGNGFTFANYRAEELLERTEAALALWHDRALRARFLAGIMRADCSFARPAAAYRRLYDAAREEA